jgi:hypothetical protein
MIVMTLRLIQVNFKARDDAELGRFWAEALGWGVSSEGPGVTNLEPEGFAWPDPDAFYIDLVTVPDPETVKYRVHLDLATTSAAHQAEKVPRSRASRARLPRSRHSTPGDRYLLFAITCPSEEDMVPAEVEAAVRR